MTAGSFRMTPVSWIRDQCVPLLTSGHRHLTLTKLIAPQSTLSRGANVIWGSVASENAQRGLIDTAIDR
jgi:hypothetical protein